MWLILAALILRCKSPEHPANAPTPPTNYQPLLALVPAGQPVVAMGTLACKPCTIMAACLMQGSLAKDSFVIAMPKGLQYSFSAAYPALARHVVVVPGVLISQLGLTKPCVLLPTEGQPDVIVMDGNAEAKLAKHGMTATCPAVH